VALCPPGFYGSAPMVSGGGPACGLTLIAGWRRGCIVLASWCRQGGLSTHHALVGWACPSGAVSSLCDALVGGTTPGLQAVCPYTPVCMPTRGYPQYLSPLLPLSPLQLASSACSGPCLPGHFCPENSSSPTQHLCGSAAVYCPAGSGAPRAAAPGEYTVGGEEDRRADVLPCPSGSYCVEGLKRPCDAGRFGCASRLGSPLCNGVRKRGRIRACVPVRVSLLVCVPVPVPVRACARV
jgi:hypothetical protein